MNAPVRFNVRARAEPETLPRLVNYVAQLGLIPSMVYAYERGGIMTVLIEQNGLCEIRAGLIAEKMRTAALVEDVVLVRNACCPASEGEKR